jgi:hypothetical protein
MNLYSSELAVEIDIGDAGASDESLKLGEKVIAGHGP